MEKRVKVIYDDECPTCTVGKNVAEKLDHAHHIEFVGMNTDEGKSLVAKHGLDMEQSAYLLDGERISQKSRMMRDVLAHNGFIGWFLSLPFRIPFVGDALYDLLALHRKHVTKTKL